MKSVLILTKTNWDEPPRIRHQVTRLFLEKGYKVTYLEKNTYKSVFIKRRKQEGIHFYSHAELLHHQLKFFPILQYLNGLVVKHYLKKIIKEIDYDFVLNFCYDYTFLKDIFPNKQIITFINDDFEAQAKMGMRRAIRNQMKKTCVISDNVLTVSYPLRKKLSGFKNNVSLFFPWSQNKYAQPAKNKERNTILYWGYVGRMDWPMIEKMISNTPYNFRFIGPPDREEDKKMVRHMLENHSNFEHIPFSSLRDLQIEDVFCSVVPYNPLKESVQACTVSNKAFNLLSLGLPLVYSDLRHLINAPNTVITKNIDLQDYKDSFAFFHKNFYEVQKDIKDFLEGHYKDSRWKILTQIIEA